MPGHKFDVGETVHLRPRFRGRVLASFAENKIYVIARRMPVEQGALNYKISSENDVCDRIADESDLFQPDVEQTADR